jgi:hypothetical protein
MAGYDTPTADYTARTNALAKQKGLQDAQRQYSQYLSQERFRRGREDQSISYKRNFPKVGSSFNRRGMWNSGLRKGGQREVTGDMQRNVGRINWDQGVNDQGFALQQAEADAAYQGAIQSLYDEYQGGRAKQGAYNQAKVY